MSHIDIFYTICSVILAVVYVAGGILCMTVLQEKDQLPDGGYVVILRALTTRERWSAVGFFFASGAICSFVFGGMLCIFVGVFMGIHTS